MNFIEMLHISVLALCIVTVLRHFFETRSRTDFEIITDLAPNLVEYGSNDYAHDSNEKNYRIVNDQYAAVGIFTPTKRRLYQIRKRLTLVSFVGIFLMLSLLSAEPSIFGFLLTTTIGLSAGYLFERLRYSKRKRHYIKDLEFYLPIVMERIVMAVQAGLDILPALGTISKIDKSEGKQSFKLDSVSQLFGFVLKLTESGLSFDHSLREVAALVDCSALRHAFVHLAIAQREGGELIMPLRELSDSTQLYYQESCEEEIAKLPVKATMPLLCTFAGLILCFITAPLIQVINLTIKTVPK